MTKHENYIVNLIKTKIKAKNPEAEIILYGSRARGDNNKYSDWDILILLNLPTVNIELEKDFRNQIVDIEIETGEAISTFVVSKQEWDTKYIYSPLYKNIKEEGRKLT